MPPPHLPGLGPKKPHLTARHLNLTLSCAMILLTGCAQMDFRGPINSAADNAIPTTWSTARDREGSAISTKHMAPEALAAWWQQLGDRQLDQLIGEALTAAPDIRIAQAKLRQSRASQNLAQANLNPSLGISGSLKRAQSGTDAGGSGNTINTYSAGFDASWEPSIFGGLTDAAVAAAADSAATAASLASTQASLAAEVALNYINLRSYQQRLVIARDNVASQAETLQIAQWRAQAGLATTLDVEQARTNLAQSQATIPGLESARATAEHRLALLTGQPPAALNKRLREARPLPTAPETVAVGIPADTIRQRPDIRAAEFSVKAEIARSAQQEAARYPSLSFSASWGWQAFSAAALGGSGSLVQSLAGSLAATLFDGGRIESRIAIQNAVQEQTLVSYEKSVLTALEDVENALSAYATGHERVAARRTASESASNAAALARTLYQAGSVDFQTVLDTDRTRLTAEDGLVSAEAELLTAVIQLYKALGGGWQSTELTDTKPGNDAKSDKNINS